MRVYRYVRCAFVAVAASLLAHAVGMDTYDQYAFIIALVIVTICCDEIDDRRSKR